jgi:uncharacterized membrane protein
MPTQPTYNQIAGQNPNRIEALSDGVFSIAMTLLVLDLKVPAQTLIHSESALWAALCRLWPSFLSYGLGFLTLGIFWVGQTTQFSFIERSNRAFSWLHIFFLATVSLIPFSTAFLNAHIQYRTAIGIYWLNILLCGLGLFVTLRYALKNNLTNLHTNNAKPFRKALVRRIVLAQLLYAIGALLCFVNNYLSIGFILLVQLNYALGIIGNGQKDAPVLPESRP